jgi:GNAT superfamily N-acetyltransferase
MLYFREPFKDLIDELYPLIQAHHYEIDWMPEKIKLDVNRKEYMMMEDQGMLICFTARLGSKLCGYASFFLHNHPHYQTTKYGVNDAFYVRPENRGGIGRALMKYCEEELIALGCQVITYNIKKSLDWSSLAVSEGYEDTETLYQKWVGG